MSYLVGLPPQGLSGVGACDSQSLKCFLSDPWCSCVGGGGLKTYPGHSPLTHVQAVSDAEAHEKLNFYVCFHSYPPESEAGNRGCGEKNTSTILLMRIRETM